MRLLSKKKNNRVPLASAKVEWERRRRPQEATKAAKVSKRSPPKVAKGAAQNQTRLLEIIS